MPLASLRDVTGTTLTRALGIPVRPSGGKNHQIYHAPSCREQHGTWHPLTEQTGQDQEAVPEGFGRWITWLVGPPHYPAFQGLDSSRIVPGATVALCPSSTLNVLATFPLP